jgi:hypothetical protein
MKKIIQQVTVSLVLSALVTASFGFSIANNTNTTVYVDNITLCNNASCDNNKLLVFDKIWLYPNGNANTQSNIPLAFSKNPTYPYVRFTLKDANGPSYITNSTNCQVSFSLTEDNTLVTQGTSECCIVGITANTLPNCSNS